jgi:hypothetical protein
MDLPDAVPVVTTNGASERLPRDRLVAVQRLDPRAAQPLQQRRVQVVGQRREHRLPRTLERLTDQPLVLAALLQERAPGLGRGRRRH